MKQLYDNVPRDIERNIDFRIDVRQRCAKDLGFRKATVDACREEVLFFFSMFCWLYEPRPRFDRHGRLMPKMIPFIPWEHQEDPIRQMRANLGVRDIIVYKSRGEGMSWIGVLLALHDWLFDPMAKIGLVSKDEKTADDPGNLDSLMAKVDWELGVLPKWMAGEKDRDWRRNATEHSLWNYRNGSQINAFAAVKHAGRAGRYKWFLADELGMWDPGDDDSFVEGIGDSTDSLLAISTPSERGAGAFHEMVHAPCDGIDTVKLRIHWSMNPAKNRGMYKMLNGQPVAVDPDHNPLPKNYDPPSRDILDRFSVLRARGFVLEGKLRSPWYDKRCARPKSTPQSIARELDLDFGGAAHRIFSHEFFAQADKTVRGPMICGNVSYHPETLAVDFIEDHNGQLKLWCQLDGKQRPPRRPYAVAADISSGLGGSHTSNSVCQIVDLINMEQVGEFACNTMEPSEFAEFCVAVSKWFYNAYLGWEANGIGGGFTKRVKDLQYQNVYWRVHHWKRGKKRTKEMGWWTDERSKELLFGDLHRMVKNCEFVLHSEALVKECGEYVRTGPQSQITNVHSAQSDPSARGKAHGDRVMAAGIALQLARERKPDSVSEFAPPEEEPHPDTLAWRMKRWKQDSEPDVWDDRMPWDSRQVDGFIRV